MITNTVTNIQASSNQVTNANLKLGTIVIAAGNSSRLGQAKQLVEFNGEPLLEKSLRLAEENMSETVCILGSNIETIIKVIDISKATIIQNKSWKTGMGTSIALGTNHFNKNFDAVLILLCDQYLLEKQDLKKLASNWHSSPNKIIASQYFDKKLEQTVLGAPAIFPSKFFSDLLLLTKQGARNILAKNMADIVTVNLPNAAHDLDTQEDLLLLRKNEKTIHLSKIQNDRLKENKHD